MGILLVLQVLGQKQPLKWDLLDCLDTFGLIMMEYSK